MTKTRTLALAAACTMTGAGGALATEAITSSAHVGHRHSLQPFFHGPGFYLGRAVHAEAVLATRDGFKDAAYDRGTVKAVSGQTLTLTEGKGTTTREESLTIPSDARIRIPGKQDATLADVQEGWKAVVVTLGSKTTVFAHPPRS
jgi:hypothetical protein